MLMPSFSPIAALSYSFTDSDYQTTGSNPRTFSAKNIGTAETSRKVVVCIGYWNPAARTVSSVTVGGVSATQIAAHNTNTIADDAGCAIYIADVPTGTTADIVITTSAATSGAAISVYAIYNAQSSTAYDTVTDEQYAGGDDAVAGSIDFVSGGVFIGLTENQYNTDGQVTWSANVTEDCDIQGGVNFSQFSSASKLLTTTAAGQTVSSTLTTGTLYAHMVFAGAVFQ